MCGDDLCVTGYTRGCSFVNRPAWRSPSCRRDFTCVFDAGPGRWRVSYALFPSLPPNHLSVTLPAVPANSSVEFVETQGTFVQP